jgi:serine/threonine protein kinase
LVARKPTKCQFPDEKISFLCGGIWRTLLYDNFFNQPSHQLLRKAISQSVAPLTLILGSGLSRPANLPDWKGLRKQIQLLLDNDYTTKTSINTSFSDSRYKKASTTDDYWIFFQIAKDILGNATFNGSVINALSTDEYNAPKSYRKLLELNPRGVATLNLDAITGQSVSEHYNTHAIIPVYGFDIARKWQIINDEKPYLVYLHGHISDPTTWVLTQADLKKLTEGNSHSLFLSQIYLNHTVIFVGLSADDVAISAPLLELKETGFSPRRLFWVTTRKDAQSEAWARENDVQKIMYAAANDMEHDHFIAAFVDDIKEYRSPDSTKILPQISTTRVFNEVKAAELSPRDIAKLECEEVRKTLSNILVGTLKSHDGDNLYDKFEEFSEKYKYPIQTKSFYKDALHPDNIFFGYEVLFPALGAGNFGEVFQAKNQNGDIVCLKVMHSNIVANREMIGGFRRGIRSMEILNNHHIRGVAKIIESFEMPPTIIMEIVPGNSLQELFNTYKNFTWSTKLNIISDIGEIVDNCHKLPEMVLHRDIKPSNIMIEGLDYVDYTYISLYVLDFDMSWHKNSSEKDIIFESRDDFGYLAPEQTDASRRISTRSAKVDSYGLGMTAFALFGGVHPVPGWTMSSDWEQRVYQIVKTGFNSRWTCLSRRTSRAIIDSTKVNQEDRLDFSSFWRRINKIRGPSSGITTNQPIDLIAEEILSSIAHGRDYKWDDILDSGSIEFFNGTSIEITVDENQTHVNIVLRYSDLGSNQFKLRNQLMGDAKDLMDNFSKKNDAKVKRANINHGLLDYYARLKVKNTLDFCKEIAKELYIPIEKLLKIQ